jgi:hypothetical protein
MCDCAAKLEQIEQRLTKLESKKKPAKSGADWLAELKANPLFKGIDFAEQERKIAIWKMKPENAHRQITKRFWLNWLAKVDTAVPVAKLPVPQPKAMRTIEQVMPKRDYEPPPPDVMAVLNRIGKGM